jgi:transcription initiation factor IIE alpha subunit
MRCKCIHCKNEFDQKNGRFIAAKISEEVSFDKMPHFFICNVCYEKVNEEKAYSMGCKVETPKPLPNPDFSKVISQCQEYIKDLEEDGTEDDDSCHYIFESAMTAVFGSDVWKWVRSKQQ